MLATAQAEIPRSARETLLSEQNGFTGLLQPDINLNAPRYFVQMGFSVVSLGTHAIPNSRLWRGEIAPCRTVAVVDSVLAIPETERIPGSERAGHDGKIMVASRRSYAHHEAEQILGDEDRSDKKSTIFELKSLRSELGDRVYRELDITKLFFPDWPNMPVRNEEVTRYLAERLEAITLNPPSGIPSEFQPQVMQILRAVGGELIQAAQRTQEIQRQEILYTHQCMKLRPNEERYKPRYDSRDIEILQRTGLPQVDAVELQTASALEKLTDTSLSGVGDTKELIAMMQQQMAKQNQIIEMLLSERRDANQKDAGLVDPTPKNNVKK